MKQGQGEWNDVRIDGPQPEKQKGDDDETGEYPGPERFEGINA